MNGGISKNKIIRVVFSSAMILVAVNNAIKIIIVGAGILNILIYSGVLIIAALPFFFIRRPAIYAVIVSLLMGIVTTYTNTNGNFSAAIFLLAAMVIMKDRNFNYFLYCVSIVLIVSKSLFLEFTASETVNLMVAYAFVFGMYYIFARHFIFTDSLASRNSWSGKNAFCCVVRTLKRTIK